MFSKFGFFLFFTLILFLLLEQNSIISIYAVLIKDFSEERLQDIKISGNINSTLTSTVENLSLNNADNNNITKNDDIILNGTWDIEIKNSIVNDFDANFSMNYVNDNYMHSHVLDYKPQDQGIASFYDFVQINYNDTDTINKDTTNKTSQTNQTITSVSILGNVDFITEGVIQYPSTPIKIDLFKNSIIIKFQNSTISSHFLNNTIEGFITNYS